MTARVGINAMGRIGRDVDEIGEAASCLFDSELTRTSRTGSTGPTTAT